MKRWIATVSAAAMSAALLVPIGAATAQEDPGPVDPAADPPGKTVVESETGSYIVVMAADPLIATIAAGRSRHPGRRRAGGRARRRARRGARRCRCRRRRQGPGLHQRPQRLLRRHQPRRGVKLAGEPESRWCCPTSCATRPPTRAASSSASPARAAPTRAGSPAKGVVVGVIDTGIWPEHPELRRRRQLRPSPARSTSPALAVRVRQHRPQPERRAVHLQQQAARRPPDARHLPRRDRRRRRRVRLRPRRRRPRHAHRLDRGRQRRRRGLDLRPSTSATISGIAPRAQIIAYKGLGNQGGFTSDLAAAIDQAVADGVDVINYSIGGGAEPRSAATPSRSCSPPTPASVGRHLGRQQRARRRHDRRSRRHPVGHDGRRQHAGALLPGHRRARQPVVALGWGRG